MTNKAILLRAASALLVIWPMAVHAQNATDGTAKPVAPGPTGQSGDTSEIVVTAERRSTSLSKTPVAVAVVNSENLDKLNIKSESDLQTTVPGLMVREGQNSNQINYAIRGQSLDAYSDTRPGVQPYFDEIQIPNSGASSTFYDLKSIQVLKGPQGTLFGRNSTGGAVLYTTQQPEDKFGGYASVGLGSYGTERIEGAVNFPIVPGKVLLRVAAFQESTDGFQYNLYTDSKLGNDKRYGVRGSLAFHLGRLDDDLVIDYQHANGTSVTGVISSIDTSSASSFPSLALYSPATSDAVLALVLQGLGLPAANANALATGNFSRYLAAHPGADPLGLANAFAAQKARGPYVVDITASDLFFSKDLVVSNITSYDLTDTAKLKNIFGFSSQDSFSNADPGGVDFGILQSGPGPNAGLYQKLWSVSDEMQIQGNAQNLKYVAGAYFNKQAQDYFQTSTFFDIIPTGAIYGIPGLWGENVTDSYRTYNTTYAAYGQGTYDLAELTGVHGLSFTLGARYTSEKVQHIVNPDDRSYNFATTGSVSPTGTVLVPASDFSNDQSVTYKNVSWSAGLEDQVDQHLLVYLDSRRSYKNGGFNGLLAPRIGLAELPIISGDNYKTETVTDIELGSKYRGRIGGIPVAFDVAAYNDWIDNSQRTAYLEAAGTPTAVTVNVPKARVYGLEADAVINPVSWLRLGGVLNYTHGAFTENSLILAGATTVFGTYPDTPHWSGDLYVEVTAPLSQAVDGTVHIDGYAMSSSYFTSTGNTNPSAIVPGYDLLNFSVGVNDHEKHRSLSVVVKNALNKVYYVGGLGLAELVQINSMQPGAPRTVMAQLKIAF